MFAASAIRRAQLPDEERLTGADLNILENETRASGRRGRAAAEATCGKTLVLQTEGRTVPS